MSNFHIYSFYVWGKIITNKLEVGVENSYKDRINVYWHLQEPFQQLFFENNPHFSKIFLFQPIEKDKLWIIDNFSTSLMKILLNLLNLSREPSF